MSTAVREEVVLKLTDAQMAAIIARIERRKRKIVECGEIDLGKIPTAETRPSLAPPENEI
jgi:hypothetical protein